nr:hypothetical protein [Tanacetum cinerariifolium]
MEILEWVIQQVSQRLWMVKSSRKEENFWESNIGDSDNTGDGGKIVGGAIGACSGGIVAWRTLMARKRKVVIVKKPWNGSRRLQCMDRRVIGGKEVARCGVFGYK